VLTSLPEIEQDIYYPGKIEKYKNKNEARYVLFAAELNDNLQKQRREA